VKKKRFEVEESDERIRIVHKREGDVCYEILVSKFF